MAGDTTRIALVTGANKGIGFEIARQLANQGTRVLIGSRDKSRGEAAVMRLRELGLDTELILLDVDSQKSVSAAAERIKEEHGRLDVLVNNAGILVDWGNDASTISIDDLRKTMETNFYGALRMIQAVLPLMQENDYGRIVNLSSTMGSLSYNSGGGGSSAPAYRLSKTALNGITAIYASVVEGKEIKINSVCPGWVRTDMGGANATRSVAEGADTAVWLATLPKDGPSGGFFKDREPLDW